MSNGELDTYNEIQAKPSTSSLVPFIEPIPWGSPDMFPNDQERSVLERLAERPLNHKSAKRARFLLMFWAGKSIDDITAELRLGEEQLEIYYTRWVLWGLPAILRLSDPQFLNQKTEKEDWQ